MARMRGLGGPTQIAPTSNGSTGSRMKRTPGSTRLATSTAKPTQPGVSGDHPRHVRWVYLGKTNVPRDRDLFIEAEAADRAGNETALSETWHA